MLRLSEQAFQRIAAVMHGHCGLAFADSKRHLIESRLSNRVQQLGMQSFDDYAGLLSRDQRSDEFQVAINLLTTNETYFFREPHHFELLEQQLSTRSPTEVSIWSAACSYGDEPYSIAMTLADLQAAGRVSQWSVLATDISEKVLHVAKSATYPDDRLRGVSRERLRRYCLRGEGDSEGWVQIKPSLQQHIRFGWINLCQPIEMLGPFDAIFLRNVLIYFDQPTKIDVVDRLLTQLKPNGMLFLGTAESGVRASTPLTALGAGAYRKSIS